MNTYVHDNLVEIPVCFTTFKKINEAKISVSLHNNAGSTSRAPSKTSGPNFSQVQFKSFQTSSFGLPGVFVLVFFGNCAYLCKQIDTLHCFLRNSKSFWITNWQCYNVDVSTIPSSSLPKQLQCFATSISCSILRCYHPETLLVVPSMVWTCRVCRWTIKPLAKFVT